MFLSGVLLAATVVAEPVVPSYPQARYEAAPTVRLEADGTRVHESRMLTRDGIDTVKRRLLRELGAGRVLSDARDDEREVLVVGPSEGVTTVIAWRKHNDSETHLLLMRRLHDQAPPPPLAPEVARAVPRTEEDVYGVPVLPGARDAGPETQRVAGGREPPLDYETSQPFDVAAAFYRAHLPVAMEARGGGARWMQLASGTPGGPTVQLFQAPGSRTTRITCFARSLPPGTQVVQPGTVRRSR